MNGPGGITHPLLTSGPQTAPQTIGIDESPAGYSLTSCAPNAFVSTEGVTKIWRLSLSQQQGSGRFQDISAN